MRHVLIAATAALTLAACGRDDSTNVPYVEPDDAPPAASRADCIEADFGGAPLMGPAYDNWTYTGPTGQPLVASSTVLYLVEGDDVLARFGALMGEIGTTLEQSDGMLGMALGGSEACGAYRTLAVWRDEGAMLRFVGSDAHVAGMIAAGEIADVGTGTTHWTFDPAVDPLDWAVAIERTAAGKRFK